jgi:hypothetical protein
MASCPFVPAGAQIAMQSSSKPHVLERQSQQLLQLQAVDPAGLNRIADAGSGSTHLSHIPGTKFRRSTHNPQLLTK